MDLGLVDHFRKNPAKSKVANKNVLKEKNLLGRSGKLSVMEKTKSGPRKDSRLFLKIILIMI